MRHPHNGVGEEVILMFTKKTDKSISAEAVLSGRSVIAAGRSSVRLSTLVLTFYIAILPISSALSGLIPVSSIPAILSFLYIALSVAEMLVARDFKIEKNLVPVYLFFVYIMLSPVWNYDFEFGWFEQTYFVTLMIIIFSSIRRYSDMELKLIKFSFYCCIIVAVLSSIFFSYVRGGRMYIDIACVMDPNDFATSLTMTFALCLTELKKPNRIMLNGLCLITILLIVYLTGSRGGLLAMLCIIFVWVLSIKGRTKYIFLTLMIAAVALLLFCAEYGIGPALIKRFAISSLLKSGGTGRAEIWKAAWARFVTLDPFHMIFGNGLGGFINTVRYVAIGNDYRYSSHNMFISTLIEGGIVGLFLFISAFVSLYIHAIKKKNLFGVLAVTGLIVSGISLDAQILRMFAIACAVALIWRDTDYDKMNRVNSPTLKECCKHEED